MTTTIHNMYQFMCNNIINITPQKPKVPTAKPKRRKSTAPKMVEIAVKNTGAVPNFLTFSIIAINKEKLLFLITVNSAICSKIISFEFTKDFGTKSGKCHIKLSYR